MVETQCTCGARLVEDARFCHRCGRPVREEDRLLESDTPEPALRETTAPLFPPLPPQATPVAALDISLRNPMVLRVGALAVGLQLLIAMVLGLVTPLLVLLAPVAGGALSAVLLNRRASTRLSVLQGARMGWLTGILSFLLFIVLLAGALLILSSGNLLQHPETLGQMRSTLEKSQEELRQAMESPLILLAQVASQFVSLTILGSLGGALGARLHSHKH
jgi:hypothetical protein